MSTTESPASPLKRGLHVFDPEKHARFVKASDIGFTYPSAAYPIDKTGGVTDLGMGGNGPDGSFTINGGKPVGDCGPNAEPKNAGQTTAAMGQVVETAWSSDRIGTLYFLYEAVTAGVTWRPPAVGTPWTQEDIAQASQLDLGVDLGDWLLWLFTHDEQGNEVQPGEGLVEGFVAVGLDHLEDALDFFGAVVVGVALNDQADAQFGAWQAGTNPSGWDVGPGDGPDPQDGHAIILGKAQSPSGPFEWGSWGAFVPSTLAWRQQCPQQAFAIFTTEDAKAKGFPVDAAIQALVALGGKAEPEPGSSPPPSPDSPPPAPAPPAPPAPGPAPSAPPDIPEEIKALWDRWKADAHQWYEDAKAWWENHVGQAAGEKTASAEEEQPS